jgi:2-oxoglutarate ferredoxin oxidoreductase subunit gamma
MRREIRIAGFGGQGVVLAGYVLGKALALYADREAVMTQSHGPEARGGASSADLVISEEPIAYPFVQEPDYLVALSQEAYTKFIPTTKPGAVILIDGDLVSPVEGQLVHPIPATKLAEDLGRRIVANVVMLGYFTAVSELVAPQALRSALQNTLNAKSLPINLEAFELGLEFNINSEHQKDDHQTLMEGT